MKKILFSIVMILAICLGGCSKDVNYTTKYIANCTNTEFRQKPSNSATVLDNLMYGEIVSFEKDVENGYSKVIHDGVTGYVLSVFLSEEKPAANTTNTHENNTVTHKNDYNNKYEYLIANQDEEYIENYISNFVRPLYNTITENMDFYSKKVSGNATLWYDGEEFLKKELPQGADNYNMTRWYYYDVNTGDMVFAFIFKGTQEHRLYFENDKLIRYIDEDGYIFNNPVSLDILELADRAISEAY